MAKRTFLTLVSDVDHDHAAAANDDAGSRTLIERAYAQLRDDIVEGRLAPGEKLRVEHLKAHYGWVPARCARPSRGSSATPWWWPRASAAFASPRSRSRIWRT